MNRTFIYSEQGLLPWVFRQLFASTSDEGTGTMASRQSRWIAEHAFTTGWACVVAVVFAIILVAKAFVT